MPNNLMSVTAPPPVYGYAELQLARESFKDSIIAAVDIENIDHTGASIQDPLEKLSEQMSFAEITNGIEARHYITDNWSWVTPKSCPAYWHLNTGKPHVADPYHCRYAASRRTATGKTAMDQISNFVGTFPNWNHHKPSRAMPNPGSALAGPSNASQVTSLINDLSLNDTNAANDQASQRASSPESTSTDSVETPPSSANSSPWEAIGCNAPNAAQSNRRHALVMFWDAHLERTTFNATENKNYDKPSTTFVDLQKWELIRRRYKDQPSCSTLLNGLGIRVPNLHNACNDAVAEVLAFIRILKFTEEEYDAWTGKRILPIIIVNIENPEAYRANRRMEEQMEARRHNRNKNKGKNTDKNKGKGPVPG